MTTNTKNDLAGIKLPSADDREFGRVEPWPEAVDLADLLDEIVATMSKHVYCDQNMLRRDAFWVVANWLSDHPDLDAFPLLVITAPDKACGKTVYLELIGELVRMPVFAGNITGPALFRIIDGRKGPTVLIDEWDSLGERAKSMMGNLVNNGYRRKGAWSYRAASKDGSATKGLDRYSVWGPKVICGIGRATPTIMSRSHVTDLQRKPRGHVLEPIGASHRAHFGVLVRKLARVRADYYDAFGSALGQARETDKVGNRGGDNWLPLRAIASLGGRWAGIVDRLAVMFSSQPDEDPSARAELLRDIGIVFAETGKLQITTAALIRALSDDPEKRWANYNGYGKAITDRQIAKHLGRRVKSKAVTPGDRLKGYRLEDLQGEIELYGAAGDEPEADPFALLLADMEGFDEPQEEIVREPIRRSGPLEDDDEDDGERSVA